MTRAEMAKKLEELLVLQGDCVVVHRELGITICVVHVLDGDQQLHRISIEAPR